MRTGLRRGLDSGEAVGVDADMMGTPLDPSDALPVADTPLGASADFTPGTYDVVAVSPDHGFTRFTLRVEGAKARTVVVRLR